MIESTHHLLEWDDAKAQSNLCGHGVGFRDAMRVLLNPLAMTPVTKTTAVRKS
jgi:uncharacterized DUF497 family protein